MHELFAVLDGVPHNKNNIYEDTQIVSVLVKALLLLLILLEVLIVVSIVN
jgi:hypothetical protein